MGTCCSVPRAGEHSQQSNDPNASSHAINAQDAQDMEAARSSINAANPTALASSIGDPHGRRPHIPPKHLVIYPWKSTSRTWSRKEIDRERRIFFETQVSGNPQAWQGLRSIVELLWAGGGPEDTDGGIKTAEAMLAGMGMICEKGDLTQRIFDVTGEVYRLPRVIVSDPLNIVEDSVSSGEDSEEELQKVREDKGKGVFDPKDEIVVRVRFHDRTETQFAVTILQQDSVRLVIKKIEEQLEISPSKQVKLFYLGRQLKKSRKTLTEQGWNGTNPLQAFIADRVRPETEQSHESES